MALTLSLFCVLVCLTWALSAAGMSVCDYFNLTIGSEVCGSFCVHVYAVTVSSAMRKQMKLSLDGVVWFRLNTHHMFNRCSCMSVCLHTCVETTCVFAEKYPYHVLF